MAGIGLVAAAAAEGAAVVGFESIGGSVAVAAAAEDRKGCHPAVKAGDCVVDWPGMLAMSGGDWWVADGERVAEAAGNIGVSGMGAGEGRGCSAGRAAGTGCSSLSRRIGGVAGGNGAALADQCIGGIWCLGMSAGVAGWGARPEMASGTKTARAWRGSAMMVRVVV